MMEEIGSNRRTGQRVAVIVGAGGMGMTLARRLGDTYRVVLADRDAEHLERQVAALRSEGRDASGVECDVTDEEAVEALAEGAASKGSVRALAHVVGVSPNLGDGPTVLRVNLLGPTLVGNAFLKRAEPGLAAVFIASMAGHREPLTQELRAILDEARVPDLVERVEAHIGGALPPFLAYQLSKTALIRLCQRRAAEWGAAGARIMSLSPGIIATPQGAHEFRHTPRSKSSMHSLHSSVKAR